MRGTMREIVSALAAPEKSEQGSNKVLIALDIEDDKLFLLHFIMGTYFGPDLTNHHRKKQSAFQIQSANLTVTSDELTGTLMKRAKIEHVYHHILRNASDPSLVVKIRILRQYFNAKRYASNEDFPLFTDLYPSKLHPESRVRNQYKLINSIVYINDPDVSCMREDCVERFKRLTGMESFTLSLNIDDETENNSNEVDDDEIDESLKEETCSELPNGNGTCTSGEESDVAAEPEFDANGVIVGGQAGPVVGLMDIGECADAYLFRVSLPGVRRDERDFSCEVEDNGKVLVRGVTTTGGKTQNGKVLVHRYSHEFEMKTQNLCPPGNFSVSFCLPGPVHPHEFSGRFGPDGILEGIIMKKLPKQSV